MKFAHFSHVWAKPGMTPHQRYEQLWRELALCDEVGFDCAFCVEHHFRPDESWMSSPLCGRRWRAHQKTARRSDGLHRSALSSAPPRRRDRHRRSDARRPAGARPRAGHQPGLFPPVRSRLCQRKSPTLEFVGYLRAAFGEKQPFSFHGEAFQTNSAELAVPPVQRPHPPLWMMSRDPQTLEFCARHAINPGYFLVYPRADAAPRYRMFWKIGAAPAGRSGRISPTAPCAMSTRAMPRRSKSRSAQAAPMRVSWRVTSGSDIGARA